MTNKQMFLTMIMAICLAGIIFCVTGCCIKVVKADVVMDTELDGTLEMIKGDKMSCSEWRDVETGVHYFYTPYGGMTPRVNADGTPYTEATGGVDHGER